MINIHTLYIQILFLFNIKQVIFVIIINMHSLNLTTSILKKKLRRKLKNTSQIQLDFLPFNVIKKKNFSVVYFIYLPNNALSY